MKWIAEGAAPNWTKALTQIRQHKMESAMFQQLKIRLGWPYLYLHRASCEHTIVFTEVRYDPNPTIVEQLADVDPQNS